MNSGKWNRDEKDLLDQSLMDNGKDTAYEHMMLFVTTRNKQSIMSYYHNHKVELLHRRKVNVSREEFFGRYQKPRIRRQRFGC